MSNTKKYFKEMSKLELMRIAISGTDGRRFVLIEKTNKTMEMAPEFMNKLEDVRGLVHNLSSEISNVITDLQYMKAKKENTKQNIIQRIWNKLHS